MGPALSAILDARVTLGVLVRLCVALTCAKGPDSAKPQGEGKGISLWTGKTPPWKVHVPGGDDLPQLKPSPPLPRHWEPWCLAQALPACAVANALGLAFLVGPLVCSPTQLQCAYLKGMGSSPDLGGFSLCPGLGRVLWRGDPPAAGLALP